MDTNVTDTIEHAVERDVARTSIRLPGELDDSPLKDGGAAAAPGSGWLSSGVGHLRSGVGRLGPHFAIFSIAGLPFLASLSPGRRKTFLMGGSALALAAVAAAGAFWAMHDNARVAATTSRIAASAGLGPQQPLAPAASLAKVVLPPPAGPVVRQPYIPAPRDKQVAEVLSLQGGQVAAEPKEAGAPAAQGPATAAHVADKAPPPPGYVPSEPGTIAPAATAPPAAVQPATSEASVPSSAAPVTLTRTEVPAASLPDPARSATRLTDGVLRDLAAESGARQTPMPPQAATRPDAVSVVAGLRPAAMTPPDQVQVLGLVTEIAAMVHDLRTQDEQLRGDLQKSTADTTARLADFERRIAFSEARSAVSSAHDAGGAPPPPAPAASPAKPVVLTRAEAALPVSGNGPAKRYHVQAASPGLALLAEVDRGGGDGAQLQVSVGESIPGYGTVKSIGQKGSGWIVTTEHGVIQ